MNFFKNKLLTIVLVLCLAFTIFIGVTANERGNIGVIQEAISSVFAPVQKYVYATGQRISNIYYYTSSILSSKKENIKLKSDIESLNKKLIDYDRYKRENDELNKILKFKSSHADLKYITGNVIGKVGENWFNMLLLDVGENDGIKKGQYVINSTGLIGTVYETNKSSCKVITIIDDKANIPAKISRTSEDGMLTGASLNSNDKLCKLNFLLNDTKAKPGDAVITSNVIKVEDVYIPSGVLIGYITKIEDDKPNLIKAAYIKPAVDFSQLEKVMVVSR